MESCRRQEDVILSLLCRDGTENRWEGGEKGAAAIVPETQWLGVGSWEKRENQSKEEECKRWAPTAQCWCWVILGAAVAASGLTLLQSHSSVFLQHTPRDPQPGRESHREETRQPHWACGLVPFALAVPCARDPPPDPFFFHSLQRHQLRRHPLTAVSDRSASTASLSPRVLRALCLFTAHSTGLSPETERQIQGQEFLSSSFTTAARVPRAVSSASVSE